MAFFLFSKCSSHFGEGKFIKIPWRKFSCSNHLSRKHLNFVWVRTNRVIREESGNIQNTGVLSNRIMAFLLGNREGSFQNESSLPPKWSRNLWILRKCYRLCRGHPVMAPFKIRTSPWHKFLRLKDSQSVRWIQSDSSEIFRTTFPNYHDREFQSRNSLAEHWDKLVQSFRGLCWIVNFPLISRHPHSPNSTFRGNVDEQVVSAQSDRERWFFGVDFDMCSTRHDIPGCGRLQWVDLAPTVPDRIPSTRIDKFTCRVGRRRFKCASSIGNLFRVRC
jgi:hypothetical protein